MVRTMRSKITKNIAASLEIIIKESQQKGIQIFTLSITKKNLKKGKNKYITYRNDRKTNFIEPVK